MFHQFNDLVHELPQYCRQLRHNVNDLTRFVRGGVGDTTSAVHQITEVFNKTVQPKESQKISTVQIVEAPTDAIQSLRLLFGPLVKPVGTAALVCCVLVIFMLLRFVDVRDRDADPDQQLAGTLRDDRTDLCARLPGDSPLRFGARLVTACPCRAYLACHRVLLYLARPGRRVAQW